MKLQGIKIIIGLGNPGNEYEKTYHNAGALFIDYLVNKLMTNDQQLTTKLITYKNFQYLKTDNFILVKPLTYMNDSGKATKETIKHFKAKPEEILIAHDDSDINLGEYKISFNRGSAGHNGIESIIKSLDTKNFWRLRIGIRPLEEKQRKKALDFVLKKIKKSDLEILKNVFEKAFKEIVPRG